MGGMISLLFVLLLVIGLILLWRGWRGVPELCEPHCKKCDYDLRGLDWTSEQRICPECGTDLTQPRTVRFGDYRRRPRMMLAGGLTLAIPVLIIVAAVLQSVLGIRWDDLRSNDSIIANLSTSAGSPWDWRKLESRYKRGRLSDEEVAAAIDQLIVYLNARTGNRGPLPWADDFFWLAVSGGHISDEQFKRLCDAFYGPEPDIRIRKRLRQGKEVRFNFSSGNPWDLPHTKHVQALREVKVDGKPVELASQYGQDKGKHYFSGGRHREIEGKINTDLPPGRYELVFEIDRGLVDEKAKLDPRQDGRPGQADRWPRTLTRHTLTVKVPIVILSPDENPIDLVTDPARDPSKTGGVSITSIQVVPEGRKLSLKPQVKIGQLPIAVCFRMVMMVDGEKHDMGWKGREENRTTSGSRGRIDSLPAGITAATVVLEPDVEHALEHLDATEIWGKPITIQNVPLERWDLEDVGGP